MSLEVMSEGYAPPIEDVRVRVEDIPRGVAGTSRTAAVIGRSIYEWSKSPKIRDLAEWITVESPDHDTYDHACRIYSWAQSHVSYRQDPVDAELLHKPDVVLGAIERRGKASLDCDCVCLFLGAMLQSIGIPTRGVKLGFGTRRLFQHIYLEARVKKGFGQPYFWLPLDPTFPDSRPGMALKHWKHRLVVEWPRHEDPIRWERVLLLGLGAYALYTVLGG